MRRTALAALALSSALAAQPTKQAPPAATQQKVGGAVVPTWAQIEKLTRDRWAEQYPREAVVAIDKIGEPRFVDEPGNTQTFSSTSSSSVWDWSWNESTWQTTIKGREGAFLRQTMAVTAERPNKTRAKFTVAALYKLVGSQWTFVEIPVGKVEGIAGAGAPAQPSDVDAAKIFAEAWTRSRPDFTVGSVKELSKEFHQSRTLLADLPPQHRRHRHGQGAGLSQGQEGGVHAVRLLVAFALGKGRSDVVGR